MPFISDSELLDFQTKIEEAKENNREADYSKNKALKDQKETTKKFKISTILLAIIAALGVAGTVYFMNFNVPSNMIPKSEYTSQVNALKNKVTSLEETIQNVSGEQQASANSEPAGSLESELIYAVQIGAFEEKDLSLYSEKYVNFKGIRSGDYNKYALGNFETLEEAKRFRKELVRMGFRDAFIASYQDGERVKIEEAW